MESANQDLLIQILTFLFDLSQQYPTQARVVAGLAMLTTLVGAASLLVEPLTALTKITPTTRDDELVGKFGKLVRFIIRALSVIARNPT